MSVETTRKRVGKSPPVNPPPGSEAVTVTLPSEFLDEIRALAGAGTAVEISLDQQILHLLEFALGRR